MKGQSVGRGFETEYSDAAPRGLAKGGRVSGAGGVFASGEPNRPAAAARSNIVPNLLGLGPPRTAFGARG